MKRELRWGAISVDDDEEIGHCCFTSEKAMSPLMEDFTLAQEEASRLNVRKT